ncbi:MAG TPA: hypothetical protein DCS97_07500 [Planctomycetes bacterium]|nr:hypothetical protein [Planctomycetota bacterium]
MLLGQRPARLGSDEVQRLLDLLSPTHIPERLNLAQCGLTSLRVLRGLPCRRLLLAGSAIRDLSPLARARFVHLELSGLQIASLDPLGGLPLTGITVYSALGVVVLEWAH